MGTVRNAFVTSAEAAVPRGGLVRLRLKVEFDTLVTLAITLLAIGLAVGYQILSRLGPRRDARTR